MGVRKAYIFHIIFGGVDCRILGHREMIPCFSLFKFGKVMHAFGINIFFNRYFGLNEMRAYLFYKKHKCKKRRPILPKNI